MDFINQNFDSISDNSDVISMGSSTSMLTIGTNQTFMQKKF